MFKTLDVLTACSEKQHLFVNAGSICGVCHLNGLFDFHD
jgi:hypothetical protein